MPDLSQIRRITTPDLREFITRRKQEISSEINCMMVGIIESFNSTDQTASIRLVFKKVLKQANQLSSGNASDRTIDYPMLVKCPVVIMNGGSGHITFPIEKGDECIVLFCDKDIDSWFESGAVLPPNSERIHDIADGIAIVGVKSLANSITSYNSTDIEIRLNGGYILIKANGNIKIYYGTSEISLEDKIRIKSNSVSLKNVIDSLCDSLTNWAGGSINTATFISQVAAEKVLFDTILKE